MLKNWQKKALVLSLFISLMAPLNHSSSLHAQWDCQEAQRNRIAMGVAGATAIGLAVGIVYLGSQNNCCKNSCSHHHSSHCSSNYSSDWSSDSDYTYYTYSDYSHHSHHSHHSDHHHHHHHVSSYSSYDVFNNARERGGKEDNLTGIFSVAQNKFNEAMGSVTAFIQLPDGTTDVLGVLDLADSKAALSFGPLTQPGNYAFGISVNPGTSLSRDEIVNVSISKNGSIQQSEDFIIPQNSTDLALITLEL